MMRNLKDQPKDRKTFNAPEEAMFLVQSVDRDKEDFIGYFYFYDAGLNLIQTLEKPEYQFDPRIRPWYLQAKSANTPDGIIQTVPYVFSSNQKIGITLATIGVGKEGVVGIDMSLTGLSRLVEKQNITPSAELVLFNSSGVVLAYRDASKIFKKNSAGKDDVVLVNELGVPALSELFEKWKTYSYNNKNSEKTNSQINVDGDKWYYRVESIDDSGAERLFLGVAIPYEELMADSIHMRNLSVFLGLVFTLLMLPAVFYASKKISRPLRDLVKIANSIQRFDFSGPDPLRSSIAEVDNLALNMTSMKHTLKRFLEISGALSRESDFEKLINIILRETISISGAVGGSLILISNDGKEAKIAAQQFNKIEQDIAALPAYNLNDGENIR
ncbi:MAG: hypothetical protein K2Q11_12555 [Burkholderiaceae bacterium]|nr:hypothetical protein [Burkholderiaceae bacterium]